MAVSVARLRASRAVSTRAVGAVEEKSAEIILNKGLEEMKGVLYRSLLTLSDAYSLLWPFSRFKFFGVINKKIGAPMSDIGALIKKRVFLSSSYCIT